MGLPILHVGATVQCAHGGQAKPLLSNPRVKMDGKRVVTVVCLYAVSGCANPPPPNGTGPCVTATWATAATRVKAGGLPVLLRTSVAVCVPTGTPLTVATTQTRVTGV
jgi:hypothetical protein